MHIRLNRRDCSSLAPLRSFLHQRSNRVPALIWGGAISAAAFPRTKLLRKAGVRFIPEQRRGHWTAPGVETLLTLSCDKTSRAPILGVFFLSIAPFLPFRLFVHKQLHTCSFLSSILFFSPFPFKPPNILSFSFCQFPSFRLLLSSSRAVLYPLLTTTFPPPSLFLASHTIHGSAPSQLFPLRANSLRAISCI